ncbi:MAG: ribonuclease J [Oscillospiraceae bacterium]|jgi:ribonuclease J|nr:ribonuclease J [Oscillospiraceae bacterium]
MSEKVKIIPLGGLGEIGKNATVYESGEDIILVDAGLGFPDDEMYGVDLVIPDYTYLVQNKHKIRGIFLTHGHEDHIGSLAYLLRDVDAPVYAAPLTIGLVSLKLAEHKLLQKSELIKMSAGEKVKLGCFTIEMIRVNHSIPDAVSLAIKTPAGIVIHTGDFKVDTTPISGDMIDLARFGELGNRGIALLAMDSTNVEKAGYSSSERLVGQRLDDLFRGCENRILVTTFASNVHRIQQVLNCAKKYGRRVAVTGRSMENIIKVSQELGYIDCPDSLLISIDLIKTLPAEKIVIITTGSQGEPMSALHRIAFSSHRKVEIQNGDRVIISASAVPGNERSVTRVIDELFRRGAEVIYDKTSGLHVSGHACSEELKMMMALTKPKFFMPLHGEARHLRIHAKIAQNMGIAQKNIIVAEIGSVIEMTSKGIKRTGTVQSGRILVDGTGAGDVGSVVMRDRKHLAQDGMIVVIVNLSSEDGEMLSEPEIITRGFVYVKESEELLREMRDEILDVLSDTDKSSHTDAAALRGAIKSALSQFLYKKTKKNPMIMTVVNEL